MEKFDIILEPDRTGSLPQPDIRPIQESGQLYIMYRGFRLTVDSKFIDVPEGFRTDGASNPRILWSITGMPRDGMHRAAAIIHDWIYENKGKMPNGYIYSRKQADQIFYAMLKHYKIKSLRARTAYFAVRSFGGIYWKR